MSEDRPQTPVDAAFGVSVSIVGAVGVAAICGDDAGAASGSVGLVTDCLFYCFQCWSTTVVGFSVGRNPDH